MKLKRFNELDEAVRPPVADKKGDSLTAQQFLFDRYKKYYPDAETFKDIEGEELNFSRIAKLMEEYKKL